MGLRRQLDGDLLDGARWGFPSSAGPLQSRIHRCSLMRMPSPHEVFLPDAHDLYRASRFGGIAFVPALPSYPLTATGAGAAGVGLHLTVEDGEARGGAGASPVATKVSRLRTLVTSRAPSSSNKTAKMRRKAPATLPPPPLPDIKD